MQAPAYVRLDHFLEARRSNSHWLRDRSAGGDRSRRRGVRFGVAGCNSSASHCGERGTEEQYLCRCPGGADLFNRTGDAPRWPRRRRRADRGTSTSSFSAGRSSAAIRPGQHSQGTPARTGTDIRAPGGPGELHSRDQSRGPGDGPGFRPRRPRTGRRADQGGATACSQTSRPRQPAAESDARTRGGRRAVTSCRDVSLVDPARAGPGGRGGCCAAVTLGAGPSGVRLGAGGA